MFSHRTIFYSLDPDGVELAVDQIKHQIEHLEKLPGDFDNPVTIAEAVFSLKDTKDALGTMMATLGDLASRVTSTAIFRGNVKPASIYQHTLLPLESSEVKTVESEEGKRYGVDQRGYLVPFSRRKWMSMMDEPTVQIRHRIGEDGKIYGITAGGYLVELPDGSV